MTKLNAVLLAMAMTAQAQWVKQPAPGVPRTRDGKPNLSAPAPKLNGKPDLTGIWQPDEAKPGELDKVAPDAGKNGVDGDNPGTFMKYWFNVLADYAPGEVELTAEGARAQKRLSEVTALQNLCLPAGPPLNDLFPFPKRLVQTASMLLIVYEGDPTRQIHMDGRKLPVDPQPAWEGYSIGRWDGDTLVVETIGLQERAALDARNHPRSAGAKMIERYRRRDYGHMEVSVRFEDPYYSKPFGFSYKMTLVPDDDLLEWVCFENEFDREHLR